MAKGVEEEEEEKKTRLNTLFHQYICLSTQNVNLSLLFCHFVPFLGGSALTAIGKKGKLKLKGKKKTRS